MKRKKFKMTRRQLLKAGLIGGAGLMLPLRFLPAKAFATGACDPTILDCLRTDLSDPGLQPKFVEPAPNALDPGFLFKDFGGTPSKKPNFRIKASKTKQQTGLINPSTGRKLTTDLWGYGQNTVSWPGQTIQVVSSSAGGAEETVIRWDNKLRDKSHLLPVDTSLHWAYSLHGDSSANGVDYRQFSIRSNGVPMVTHLHGGNSDFQYDGNPEFFYSPNETIQGPQWDFVEGGFTNTFRYNNGVPAGNLWYHDHALGITRLNVYAGLAGFYFVRDEFDTGLPGNPLKLPAFPYELAYAIQDRMFTDKGALFYPAFPGDPYYADFIETALPDPPFEGEGPTALAEFFGDHIVVNGKIWPKVDVEPRHYRMHLLNGCDSRFLAIQFRPVPLGDTDLTNAGSPLPFYVIGSDQGLGRPATSSEATSMTKLVIEPGGRYDVVIDFSQMPAGKRVIIENLGGDEPFGGLPGTQVFECTDRIMAFDVVLPKSSVPDNFDPSLIPVYTGVSDTPDIRRVALFEGMDEFERLQPLLGTVADDITGTNVATAKTWFLPTTETPTVDTTEIWEIYNFTADGHPVHLHLVNFEILDRTSFTYEDGGTQQVLQHNGEFGTAPKIDNIQLGTPGDKNLGPTDGYFESAPKDMVTALPGDPDALTGERTRIRVHFDKAGRYVWHCHILSHEDHEMMRVLEVVQVV